MKVTGVLAEKGLHVFDQEGRIHAGHVALRVWILVADHAKAKLYRKADHHFQEIACMESKSHHHHQGHGTKKDLELFSQNLAEWLISAQDEHVFDRIVMVAPSDLLSAFRDSFSPSLQSMVAAEIPKDMANMNGHDIEKALEKIVII